MQRLKRWSLVIWMAMCFAFAGALVAQEAVDAGQEAVQAGEEEASPSLLSAGKEVVNVTLDTGKKVAGGVRDATVEVGQALHGGGTTVVSQSRKLWQDAVLPMLHRLSDALVGVAKAAVLLLAFWLIGSLLGAAVTKVLSLTNIDNRAVKDWGLQGLIEGPGGQKRSLEKLLGRIVKWVILLFGFVAFFNALNLPMVAGPLQNVVDKIVGVIPNLLKAFVILLVYWIVGTLLKTLVTKGLKAVKFDESAAKYFLSSEERGKMVGPSDAIGRLLFYVVLLFGVLPFLQALGQEALLQPLQDMLSKILAFLPNVFAAALLMLIGVLIARIVRNLLVNFMVASGIDAGAEKLGVSKLIGNKKASNVIGLIAYIFIIVTVFVSAIDSLQVKVISDPITATLEKILGVIPALLGATVIVLIGYFIARFVRGLVESFLSGVGFDALPEKLGLSYLSPMKGSATLSSIVGAVVMIVIYLLTAQQAFETLHLTQLSALTDQVVRYVPQLVVAIIILVAALSLGAYAGGLVTKAMQGGKYAGLASGAAKYAIIFLGTSMALTQLGVGEQIVLAVVTAILGGTALALGLAFGLGGKDKAKSIIEK